MLIALKMAALIIILVLVVISDLKEMIIPNSILLIGAGIGIIFAGILPSWSWLLGAVIGAGIFLVMYLALPGMLGEGDIKLVGLIGLYLGWPNIMAVILLSILAGAAISMFLVLIRKATMQSKVPFAPFLGIGAVATIFFQSQIWQFIGYVLYGF